MSATIRLVSSTVAALALFVAGGARCDAQSMTVQPEVFDAAIRERVAALVGPARTIELTSQKAEAAKAAILRGDYAAASAIAGEIIAASRNATWRSHPMALFMQDMFEPRDNGYVEKLSEWVAKDGASAIPYLIRAKNYLELGWQVRGDKFAGLTRPDHLAAFARDMDLAKRDALKAIELDDKTPYGFFLLLRILQGQNSPDIEPWFQQGVTRFPDYLPLYQRRMETLAPKWGGSVAAMYAFVDAHAASASETSPRRFLYLDLYAGLLDAASIACRSEGADTVKSCVAAKLDKLVAPDLDAKVEGALGMVDKVDQHEFVVALEPILLRMLGARGGALYSGKILQYAADKLGSSNQLVEDNAAHNNYMLDAAAATVWLNSGFFDNAETKFRQALKDLDRASFPNEEERLIARAAIYDGLARVYRGNAQFDNVLAYRQAAVALVGNTNADLRYLTCYAYYRLKRFADAKRECAAQVDATADLHARFYRGQASKALGDPDAALADLQAVAGSEDYYRVSAAIGVSVLYADRRDYRAMIDFLNGHAYLFNKSERSAEDLAISFNNRCFGYMKLGELQKAMDDCTASLRYGSLPDAYQKQQELAKLLAK